MRRAATNAAPERALAVEAHEAGARLDRFLAARLGLSRAQVRRLLERRAVSVDGRGVDASAKGEPLAAGARVGVRAFRPPQEQRATAEPEAALHILARGPGWIAVDKPAGVPVHPLREGELGTVLGAVAARHPEVHGVGEGGLRSGVVHRLDIETSGVLLVATEQRAWERLRAGFREHRVEKRYLALVSGRWQVDERIEVALAVSRHRPARVRVVPRERAGGKRREGPRAASRKPEGRAASRQASEANGRASEVEELSPPLEPRGARIASLRVRSVECFAGATLVEVRPRTGFLHQIRVTLAHRGHPVLGDRRYGPPPRAEGGRFARHLLHAAGVVFEDVRAESAPPSDFRQALEELRREA